MTEPLTDDTALLPDPETMTAGQIRKHFNNVRAAYFRHEVSVEAFLDTATRYDTTKAMIREVRRSERTQRPWWLRWRP